MSKTSISNFPVNVGKFRREVERRGLTITRVSQDMGRNNCYISKKLQTGFFNVQDAIALDTLYHISRDLYEERNLPAVKEPEEPIDLPSPVVVNVDIDYDKLYDTIFNAVGRAFTKALAGEVK